MVVVESWSSSAIEPDPTAARVGASSAPVRFTTMLNEAVPSKDVTVNVSVPNSPSSNVWVAARLLTSV